MSSIELLVQAVDKDSNCEDEQSDDQVSSDDSSSYKSPEIDSDELAAMGDNDLVWSRLLANQHMTHRRENQLY